MPRPLRPILTVSKHSITVREPESARGVAIVALLTIAAVVVFVALGSMA